MLLKIVCERSGAHGLDNRDSWHAFNQAKRKQLAKAFPERRAVAEIAAGNNQVSGRLPTELFRKFKGNSLLPFNAKRIDRIDEIQRTVFGEFTNLTHSRITVSLDLQNSRTVVQRLCQLCMAHLTSRYHDGAGQIRSSAIRSQACCCVACAGASDQTGAE